MKPTRVLAAVLLSAATAGTATAPALAHNPSTAFPIRWNAYGESLRTISYKFQKTLTKRRYRSRICGAGKSWTMTDVIRLKCIRGESVSGSKSVCAPADAGGHDGVVKWGHVGRPRGAISVTSLCIDNQVGRARRIRAFAVTFDDSANWYGENGHGDRRKKPVDLKSVATHEFGHVLGGVHYNPNANHCQNNWAQETMCPIHHIASERQRSIGKHDVHTLKGAYPSPIWWGDGERRFSKDVNGRIMPRDWLGYTNDSCVVGSTLFQPTGGPQAKRYYRFHTLADTRDSNRNLLNGEKDSGIRCELGQGNTTTRGGYPYFHEGDDNWISWQVRLDPNFPASTGSSCDSGNFQVIAQWKQLGGHGTPALSLGVNNGRFCLNGSDDKCYNESTRVGGNTHVYSDLGDASGNKGRWIKFTMHVRFAPDSTGLVEIWGDLDNDPQHGLEHLAGPFHRFTMKVDEAPPFPEDKCKVVIPSHSRIGVYRSFDSPGTADVYYDGYTVARTRTVAEANAFRDSAP